MQFFNFNVSYRLLIYQVYNFYAASFSIVYGVGGSASPAATLKATTLCAALRDEGFEARTDIVGRGLKAQMRYANKIGTEFTLVLGDSELESGKAKLKYMESGEETEVELDKIADAIYDATFARFADELNI